MDRNGSPAFYKLLDEMAETHDKKSHDYASNENPSGNYHFAGTLAKLFDNYQDAGFAGRIGEKIYRLANLENSGKNAKNESIEDTERDIAVITCLWIADRRERRFKARAEKLNTILNEPPTGQGIGAGLNPHYDVGERYPGPPNEMKCNDWGVRKKKAVNEVSDGLASATALARPIEVIRSIQVISNYLVSLLSK